MTAEELTAIYPAIYVIWKEMGTEKSVRGMEPADRVGAWMTSAWLAWVQISE
jgi:hypothetical protein